MLSFDEKFIEACRRRSRESQEVTFPYFVEEYGMRFQVNEHVFSPVHCGSFRWFVPRLPDVIGLDVLEIGSGHGIVSCHLAQKARRVVATDINPAAVKNTAQNAGQNNLNNIECVESDVFSNVTGKFDLIFWNTPWGYVPEWYLHDLTPEEMGMFDPSYKAISRYFLEAKDHLKPNGALFIGFGHTGADLLAIDDLTERSGLIYKSSVFGKYTPGERDDHNKPIEMQIELRKLVHLPPISR